MSPRTGRPPSENPKSERITIRMDEYHQKMLLTCAQNLRQSKAEVLCNGLEIIGLGKENDIAIQLLYNLISLSKLLNNREQYEAEKYNELLDGIIKKIELDLGEFLDELKK